MKIIDAYWEKRNLGVNCVEVTMEEADNAEEFLKEVFKIKSDYIVVKIPSEKAYISFELCKENFVFIEAMNHLVHNLNDYELSGRKKEIYDNTQFIKMNDNEIKVMLNRISEGLYNTDRVSLDPAFSIELASKRYVGWIKDELDRGAEAYKFVNNDCNVGFIIFKTKDSIEYEDILTGIYPEYQGMGYSVNMTYKLVDEVKKRGGKRITTNTSCSNIPSLRSSLNNGYNYDSCNYIFVKHMNL